MSDTPAPTQRDWRRALWAALLSLYQPGLGQVYAGAWRPGIALFVIAMAAVLLTVVTTWIAAPTPVAVAAFIAIGTLLGVFHLGAAIDAARRVRQAGVPARGPWYRSTWVAAVVMIGLSVSSSFALNGVQGWRPFHVASSSTMPGLMPGDYVFVDVRHRGMTPAYGDVVVFRTPKAPTIEYIKRVVGLPGDYVELRDGILYLNDRAVQRQSTGAFVQPDRPDRAYKRYRETLPNGRAFDVLLWKENDALEYTLPVRVPAGHVFVLGDNRDDSIDSRARSVGFIPQANIEGRAYTIYWSDDLSRLFKPIE